MKVDKKLESHLATLLEGYEANKKQVDEFIQQCQQQLDGAVANQQQTLAKIADLKEILELDEEEEVAEETMEASE